MRDLEPGLQDAVADAQHCFRTVLDAMARPGRIATIGFLVGAPARMSPAGAAILLTLADIDAPVWLGKSVADAADWIRFHTGAAITSTPWNANFAYLSANEIPKLGELNVGTDEYPDRSTTLIVEVSRLSVPGPLVLRGPGIERSHSAAIEGPGADFWRQRDGLKDVFPRGLDCIFVCGSDVLALPRTTQVEI